MAHCRLSRLSLWSLSYIRKCKCPDEYRFREWKRELKLETYGGCAIFKSFVIASVCRSLFADVQFECI